MKFVILTKENLPTSLLKDYGIEPLHRVGAKYVVEVSNYADFIRFLLETDRVRSVLYKDKPVPKEEFLHVFTENLLKLESLFGVKYQKIFDPDGKVVGAEFFCMFPLPPFVLMQVLKDSSFTDFKCFKSVLAAVEDKKWDKKIFFNLFPGSIEKTDFVVALTSRILAKGLQNQFTVEVLEYQLTREKVKKHVQFMRSQGLQIAIDDWGSEHAGISRIVEFKPEYVKIDKSITWNAEARDLFEPIVPKLQERGVKVIVEGIENEEHYNWAKKLNTLMQGFFLHKPEPFWRPS